MKKFNKMICMMLLSVISLMLTGCYDQIYLSSNSNSTAEPITPYNENIKKINSSAVCYFGYNETDDSMGQEYLIAETHTIDYTSDNYELTLLKELVKGPNQTVNTITSLFQNGTTFKVIKKEGNKFITVIISKAFLNAPLDFPTDWETRSEYIAKYNRIKRMAIYSIVDTLTETGKYDRVQILIDRDGSGIGKALTRGEAGFTGEGQNELLEAFYRDTDIILTPANTFDALMYYLKQKSYENLYTLIMMVDLNGDKRPIQEEIINALGDLSINIISYGASKATVSPDGLTSTLLFNGEIQIGTGTNIKTKYYKNSTIRLIKEDGIWKIQYNDLIDMLTN